MGSKNCFFIIAEYGFSTDKYGFSTAYKILGFGIFLGTDPKIIIRHD